MRRTAPILWAAPPDVWRDLRCAPTIDCKNTRSYYLIRLRFLQSMQPHNLSTFYLSAIALATADPQQSLNLGIS